MTNDIGKLVLEVEKAIPEISAEIKEKHEDAIARGTDSGIFMGIPYSHMLNNLAEAAKIGGPDLARRYYTELIHGSAGNVEKMLSPKYVAQM